VREAAGHAPRRGYRGRHAARANRHRSWPVFKPELAASAAFSHLRARASAGGRQKIASCRRRRRAKASVPNYSSRRASNRARRKAARAAAASFRAIHNDAHRAAEQSVGVSREKLAESHTQYVEDRHAIERHVPESGASRRKFSRGARRDKISWPECCLTFRARSAKCAPVSCSVSFGTACFRNRRAFDKTSFGTANSRSSVLRNGVLAERGTCGTVCLRTVCSRNGVLAKRCVLEE
jgi:hypothetical protein